MEPEPKETIVAAAVRLAVNEEFTQEYWLEGLGYPPKLMDRLGLERPISPKPPKQGFWSWISGKISAWVSL